MTTDCSDLSKSNSEQAGLLCLHSSPPADWECTEVRGRHVLHCLSLPPKVLFSLHSETNHSFLKVNLVMFFPCSKTKNLSKIQCPYNPLRWCTWLLGLWLTSCPHLFPTLSQLWSRYSGLPNVLELLRASAFLFLQTAGSAAATTVWCHSLFAVLFKCHLIKDGFPI